MKKTLLLSLLCAALVVAFALPSLHAAPAAPADMVIKHFTEPLGKKAQAKVPFSHTGHAQTDCKVCHHKWDGSAAVVGCASDGCHTDLKAKKGDASLYMAFHAKGDTSCQGCHKAQKKAGQKTGPTSCKACHSAK